MAVGRRDTYILFSDEAVHGMSLGWFMARGGICSFGAGGSWGSVYVKLLRWNFYARDGSCWLCFVL